MTRNLRIVDKPDDIGPGRAVNYPAEDECLAVPLWLLRNGQLPQSLEAVRLLAEYDPAIFFKYTNCELARAYGRLAERGVLPTDGLLIATLRDLRCWSDNEGDKGVWSPGALADLEEKGRCGLWLRAGGTATQYLLENYLPELTKLYRQRETIRAFEAGLEQAQKVQNPYWNNDVGKAIGQVLNAFSVIPVRDDAEPHKGPLSVYDLAVSDLQRIEGIQAGTIEERRLFTGYPNLDTLTGGFEAGNLILVPGRTAMGKTSFGLAVAWYVASRGLVVLYVTLEMSAGEIQRRLAGKATRINTLKLRHGTVRDFEQTIYRNHAEAAKALHFYVDDRQATPSQLRDRISDLAAKVGPDVSLVVLDHVQLLGLNDKRQFQNRHAQLSHYAAELKALAKEMNCVVLALSQLNRQSEHDRRPPGLSDIRESGSLAEMSDLVVGLYRPHVDDGSKDETQAFVYLLKNRHGPCGKVELRWLPAVATFADLDTDPAGDDNLELTTH
jgi:replicative DNA helicase